MREAFAELQHYNNISYMSHRITPLIITDRTVQFDMKLEHCLNLMTEVLGAYESIGFQRKLAEIESGPPGLRDEQWSKLIESAHEDILWKYGLPLSHGWDLLVKSIPFFPWAMDGELNRLYDAVNLAGHHR